MRALMGVLIVVGLGGAYLMAAPPVKDDSAAMMKRIAALEERVETLRKLVSAVGPVLENEVGTKLLIADRVETKTLIVRDKSDKESMTIGVSATKGGALLSFHRGDSSAAMILAVNTTGSSMMMSKTNEVPQFRLLSRDSGGTGFVISDVADKSRIVIGATPIGEPEIELRDANGDLRWRAAAPNKK
jgi:hypothetical protein